MDIDKGLIRHWAMLFESEEMKNNGGVSGGFNDEELKTMYHNEWTFFDLKNEKMYGSDEFFLLMMYGFYDNFFLSDSEKDV